MIEINPSATPWLGRLCHDGAFAKLECRDETEVETLRWKTSVFQAVKMNFGTEGEANRKKSFLRLQ